MKPKTMKQVAETLGVSVATVSRALTRPERVAEKTRKRVLEGIADLNYTMNSLAQNLRKSETRSILVVVPLISSPFNAEVFLGVERAALELGFSVLMGNTERDVEREEAYFQQVLERRADGIILLTGSLPKRYADAGSNGGRPLPPLVLACEYMHSPHLPTVRIDHERAAITAVEHLLELGHRRIAHITGSRNVLTSRDRLRGYRKALKSAGVEVNERYIAHGDFSIGSGQAAMKRLLKLKTKPTAVFSANDEMAIGAMQSIKAAGLKVPQDISVVGFDDLVFAEVCDPPLTTIQLPRDEIGRRAMMMLGDLLESRAAPEEIVLPTTLIVRESTAAVRRRS